MGKLKVIYMSGGAEFALAPLKVLKDSRSVQLSSIYTKMSRPAGRGKKIKDTPILEYVKNHNLDYRCPTDFKNNEEVSAIKNMQIDFILVFSYGLILPKQIIEAPKYSCINIHPSLLPKWRGPSPIQYSLLNSDKETGFCFMEMQEGIDTGDILFKRKVDIKQSDNSLTLLNKISAEASLFIEKVFTKIIQNKITKSKQDHSQATYSYKIEKKDTIINFQEEALKILAKIKAFGPNPCARCYINGEIVKIYDAEVINNNKKYDKSGIILDDKLLISCGIGSIRLLKIQREGKKVLPTNEVLNGWKLDPGTKINAN